MKNALCIALFLSLSAVAITPDAKAQDQPEFRTIDVIGTGRIYGEDISGARDQAISDCLVTAISLAASALLQQQVFIQSFQDINRLLFSRADRFIQNYKVLTEDSSGRVYRVMVQATVSVEKIRELLVQNDILSRNAPPLKVLLLIAEQDLETVFYRYWWGDAVSETISEAPLAGALIEQGFIVVDRGSSWPTAEDSDTPEAASPGPEMNDNLAAPQVEQGSAILDHVRSWPIVGDSDIFGDTPPGPEMSNNQAAALGARFQADVVVVGTATAKKASNILGEELKSFEGILTVRAIRSDTGIVLAEITRKFLTADADDIAGSRRALLEASSQTGELLAGKIMTAWQETSEKGPTAATIVVEGSFQLSQLVAFRRILSGIPGVSSLQTRGMTPSETTLSLDYDGTTKGLAEALLLKSFEGFGVHITETTPETLRLSLISN